MYNINVSYSITVFELQCRPVAAFAVIQGDIRAWKFVE